MARKPLSPLSLSFGLETRVGRAVVCPGCLYGLRHRDPEKPGRLLVVTQKVRGGRAQPGAQICQLHLPTGDLPPNPTPRGAVWRVDTAPGDGAGGACSGAWAQGSMSALGVLRNLPLALGKCPGALHTRSASPSRPIHHHEAMELERVLEETRCMPAPSSAVGSAPQIQSGRWGPLRAAWSSCPDPRWGRPLALPPGPAPQRPCEGQLGSWDILV